MSEVDKILAERGKVHGPFYWHSHFSQRLKGAMTSHGGSTLPPSNYPDKLPSVMCESLEMIQHKVARILSGDPNHIDHWDDIAGYATLVATYLRAQKSTQGSDPSFGVGKPEQP